MSVEKQIRESMVADEFALHLDSSDSSTTSCKEQDSTHTFDSSSERMHTLLHLDRRLGLLLIICLSLSGLFIFYSLDHPLRLVVLLLEPSSEHLQLEKQLGS